MKKVTLVTALLSSLAFVGTAAHAYQTEVNGNYNYLDPDNGDGVSVFGASGTYYFNPVQTRNSPLAEAAFLDRASSVTLGGLYGDNDGTKQSSLGLSGEYYVPNSDFYLGAGVARDETKVKNFSDTKTTRYNAEVGYLPAPGLLVALGLQGYDTKDGGDDVDPTLRAKYVTQVGQHDVNLEARGVFGNNDNKQYYVAGDYYIDKTLSVGADYQKDKAPNLDQWGITAKKFFNQQVSVDGRLGFGDDYNTYSVGASYRF
ncbi:putative porin [Acinetobacter sp.]|uniref:putative porin n=1 Tax=Acinetobacter sp. TaxID=472 RepID=UPI000C094A42|nr:putative porin [Acinetobacter sp.]MAK29214.1 putative porin [Acinetobacter sp.]